MRLGERYVRHDWHTDRCTALHAETPADGARTYIWDPEDVVAYIDGTQLDVSVPVEDLPASVTDTGFRDGVAELWLDSADPTVLFRVGRGVADRFVLDEPRKILCE